MAELTGKIRGWFRGAPQPANVRSRQQAAREQLHGHIDEGLLEGFIRRKLNPEQHKTVLGHLNKCGDCREAVAVVILARQDPTAAAAMVLESEKRAKRGGVWWRIALRWTSIVCGVFAIALLLYLLPAANSPNFLLSNLFSSSKNSPAPVADSVSESDTAFSEWISSTLSNKEEKAPEEKPRKRSARNVRQVSPGWDTGPAPRHDHVEGMPAAIEVEIPRSEPVKHEDEKSPSPAPTSDAPAEKVATVFPAKASGAKRAVSERRLVVTDEGELMRTLDGGATWKIITIKPGLAFNSLAVSGSTVWAAGDNGALFRSPDAERWQQVILKYRGVPLTDHIDQIRFADLQHGQFITASGDSWITVDGGNNWTLSLRHRSSQ
jgi:hypothetical protein